jgi:outer membrane protein assembly factor BamE
LETEHRMPAAHSSHRTRLLLALVLLLAGCKQVPMLPTLTPYKIDVQQGNYVTQDMVEKLKPGMTRSQVRFLLGTPLVVDPFRNDRWDYVYLYYKAGELAEQRRISVIFDQDKLKRVDGDVVAAGAEATKKESAQGVTPAKPPTSEAPADKKPASGAAAAGTPAAKAETSR